MEHLSAPRDPTKWSRSRDHPLIPPHEPRARSPHGLHKWFINDPQGSIAIQYPNIEFIFIVSNFFLIRLDQSKNILDLKSHFSVKSRGSVAHLFPRSLLRCVLEVAYYENGTTMSFLWAKNIFSLSVERWFKLFVSISIKVFGIEAWKYGLRVRIMIIIIL